MRQALPVSIVIPVRNEAASLGEMFADLLSLSPSPSEIVFVETGSVDGSQERIDSWLAVAERAGICSCLVNAPDAFPGAARNAGVRAATQPWIAFLDAGISPKPDWLGRLWNAQLEGESLAVYGGCRFRTEHPFGRMIAALSYGQDNVAPVLPASLFHRQVFEKAGYFQEDLRSGEDILWNRSIASAGIPTATCVAAEVEYRHFPETLWRALNKWFVYEQSAAVAGLSSFCKSAVLTLVACVYGLLALNVPVAPFGLVAYLAIRGGLEPIRRSAYRRWWNRWWQPIAIIPVAALLDMATIAGRLTGWIGLSKFRLHALDVSRASAWRDERRPRILLVVAVPMTVKAFLLRYISKLAECYDVTVACSHDAFDLEKLLPTNVCYRPLDIARKVSPIADLVSLIKLILLIREERFSLVHSVTPKAGLLGQLAAWVNRVPVRVHTFTGQVWATKQGLARSFLKAMDRLMAFCATDLLADSESQRQFLIANQVVGQEKIKVLGNGSIAGVDSERFHPDSEIRHEVRRVLGCGEDQVLGLFLGRLSRDKGVLDLVNAFVRVAASFPTSVLLLVGPDEEGLAQELERLAGVNGRVRLLGATNTPERFMAAADFFCLPSYREGFGTVVIEAAACGLPAMVSEIYGLTDAVEKEVSGVFHPPRDVEAIATLLARYLGDQGWRRKLGAQARERAVTLFSAPMVANIQLGYVRDLLRDHGLEQTVS